jgi:hypothetical protein
MEHPKKQEVHKVEKINEIHLVKQFDIIFQVNFKMLIP